MKFKQINDSNRVVCADDPTIDVFVKEGGFHAGPTDFFVGMDGKIFSFTCGLPDGGSHKIDGPLPEKYRFYTITEMLRYRNRKVILRSKPLKDNTVESTATSFASCDQQERVIEALTGGIAELGKIFRFRFSRVKFSNALQQRLINGDFIS